MEYYNITEHVFWITIKAILNACISYCILQNSYTLKQHSAIFILCFPVKCQT